MGAHQCRHEGAQLGGASRPGAGGNLLGSRRVDPRKPGAKRGGRDSSMGGKPRPSGGTQDHPVYTVAAERGCGVDCKASNATSRNRVVFRRRMTGPSRAAKAAGRPSPRSADRRGVQARERAGQAQPDRKVTSESGFGKCRYRGNLPESLSVSASNRPEIEGRFEHENAAKLAFLDLKGHHFVATSTTECSRFERVRDQKTSVFMPHSFASRHAGPKPYTGRACLSPQRPSIGSA